MKKCGYTGLQTPKNKEEKLQELEYSKDEETCIPKFAEEVPVSSDYRKFDNKVEIDFRWNKMNCHHLRAEKLVYRKGENLKEHFRFDTRDGVDSHCTKKGGETYILRKTTKEIAQALFNAYGKIKGALEKIVGWIKTVLGNVYVISKIDVKAWSFDKRLTRNPESYVELDDLDSEHRKKLCEIITEKLAELHSAAVVLGNFTLNSILLTTKSAVFTDLRNMRVSRKRSRTVEEFMNVMQYLFAVGVAEKEDIYHATAVYAVANEKACVEWYTEKTGKKAKTTYDIVRKIEDDM